MKVRCTSNTRSEGSNYQFLEAGECYTVYGMAVDQGEVLYYICERENASFPIARPAHLFEIIDNRLSRYWVFGVIESHKKYPSWSFPEWINEPYFQDKITDWETREVNIFKSYKELMDMEFPDSAISEIAQVGDAEWLICPSCLNPWQYSDDRDALVKCPQCKKIMNNPRYKNERSV
jgi:hypothetical protein